MKLWQFQPPIWSRRELRRFLFGPAARLQPLNRHQKVVYNNLNLLLASPSSYHMI